MFMSQKMKKLSLAMLGSMILSLGCGSGHRFNEPSVPVERAPLQEQSIDAAVDQNSIKDDPGTKSVVQKPELPVPRDPDPIPCSSLYTIPGIANPFLAGMPEGTQIAYPASVDRVPANAPILVTPTDKQCFEAGRYLYFQVAGKIAHGNMTDQESDADGIPTAPGTHTLASLNNLSNIEAPINSLIGIFLDDKAPNQRPVAPATLDFSKASLRNFKNLTPQLGQIFFIGDAKDAAGKLQGFAVPVGTTRLYLAIMDAYEWNNNLGKLSGGILWVKP